MEQKTRFARLKKEILKRAHAAQACTEQYGRAYKAESVEALMTVVKDNFSWCCKESVLTPDLISEYEEFAANGIFANQDVDSGYLLASGDAIVEVSGNAIVEASGDATVEAWDNAKVRAWGNATVRAWDNATVEALDTATVRALDTATVRAFDNATVEALDTAKVWAWDTVTVRAFDNAQVRASGNATVEASDFVTVEAFNKATARASDFAYVVSIYTLECKILGNAIYRVINGNTVYYASDDIKFEKQKQEEGKTRNMEV